MKQETAMLLDKARRAIGAARALLERGDTDFAIGAGRTMLAEIDRHASAGRNFAFETTLSGHTYVRRIAAWRTSGYLVKLIFLALATPEEAIARVAMRVRQGGHHVESDVVRSRFESGLKNFREIDRHRVDSWQWYDNGGSQPILLAEGPVDE